MFIERKLSEIAIITMGTSPKGLTYNRNGEGLPLLNGPTEFGDIYPNCTLFTNKSIREGKPGDLIFCVRGSTTGRMNWADRIYSLGRGVCSIRGKSISDTRFIKYCLDWKLGSLLNLASGGTFPNLTQETIRNFSIPYPESRYKIASILSAYDDLIENNQRRIKILEEMAQNLYREWFVRFRFPGHENVRFVDSPLGKMPEGWCNLFSDYVDFLEGPGLRNWQYRDEGIPFLNIRTLVKNDIDFSKIKFLEQEEVDKKYKHFLLNEYDHVVSSSGTLGRIVTIQKHHLPLMLNTSIIRMRPKTVNIGKWQLKHYLQSDYFQHQILSFAIGAAQPNYGPSHLKQMHIVNPTSSIGQMYESIVEPLEENIGTLIQKNNILRRKRDLLLPKLISGEVDVSELDVTIPEEN